MNIVKLVLEITKPIGSIDILSLTKHVIELKNVKSVIVRLSDTAQTAQILILIIEGNNLDYEYIARSLEKMNIIVNKVIEIHALKESFNITHSTSE